MHQDNHIIACNGKTYRRSAFRRLGGVTLCALNALTLYGCNDPKASNARNFETAVNSILQKQNPAHFSPGVSFPFTYVPGGYANVKTEALDTLVKVGLVSSHPTTAQTYDYGSMKSINRAAVLYDLTEVGRKLSGQSNRIRYSNGFKWGDATVAEIENFADAGFGAMKMAQVKYKYRIQNIESWAKDAAVQAAFPELTQAVKEADTPKEAETTLIQTSNGWTDKL